MKSYLDTSALIRAWRLEATPSGVTRSHSFAEFYSTLTGGITVFVAGVKTRIAFPPKEVVSGAQGTFSKMIFCDLTPEETLAKLGEAAQKNVQSANVHDFMHIAAAEKAGCSQIVTANDKHFAPLTDKPIVSPAKFFA